MTDFLAAALRERPDAVAVDDGTTRWSFADLDERAARMARVLVGAGAGPGRTVVVAADPSLDALAALHGAFRTGALVAPLHPALAPAERAAAHAALAPTVSVGVGGLDLDRLADEAGAAEPLHDRADTDPMDPAAVLWTSGTSGQPRGVCLSSAALRASADGSRRRLGLSPDDVWYASLSPAHVGGLALLTRAALLGSGLLLRGRFDIDELDELFDADALTHLSLVPTMLLQLLEAREGKPAPPRLRCILIGGARAPRPLVDRAHRAGLPLALSYGLTEAASQVATAPPEEVRAHPDGVGRPLHGVEVRISPAGEILVRGSTLASRLLDGRPVAAPDGWLATGDIGEVDAEGRLRVTGRRSDRIVSGGVTVDAHEIEARLREHPGVADACVVGLDDATWGERVAAAVVTAPGGPRDPDTLIAWLRPGLSKAKWVRELLLVDALPLNRNGKVDRGAVRLLLSGANPDRPQGLR